MNVLVTGAFGNVGISTIDELLARGHKVSCFDLKTPLNQKTAQKYGSKVDIYWGDLRDAKQCAVAVADQDAVIHLASIIPPISERQPELARAVNVEGTRNLIEATTASPRIPRFIFASSVSVHGRGRKPRLLDATSPLQPSDNYSGHKVECEALLAASNLVWTTLRLNAVIPLNLGKLDPIMFDMGLDEQVEFVHTRDVGYAFAAAVEAQGVEHKTFMIGGGKACQMTYREFYARLFGAIGIGALPEAAYGDKPYYTNWMDSADGNTALAYQKRTYDVFLQEMAKLVGWRKPFILLLKPFVRAWLLRMSPYYQSQRVQIAHPFWWAIILFGMTLTGVLAFNNPAFALWSKHVTPLLPQGLIQGIFIVAVGIHVGEAIAAYRLARKIGHHEAALGWCAQTVFLGYASLGLLVKRAKASPMGPRGNVPSTSSETEQPITRRNIQFR